MNGILRISLAGTALALLGCVGYGAPASGYAGNPAYGGGSQAGGYYPPSGGYPGYPGNAAGGVVRCESNDGRTRYCNADIRGGVRLSRQLSNTQCIQGRNWSYDNRGIWVSQGCRAEFVTGVGGGYGPGYGAPGYGSSGQTVRCESNDGRTRYCNADIRGGVRLSRQLSNTQCIQGRNWGYDNRGIWVSQGCRAEFMTGVGGGYQPGYGTPGYGGSGQAVRCESQDGRYQRCGVPVYQRVDVYKQLSKTTCVRGQNWNWDRNGIWVDKGCRAEFKVF